MAETASLTASLWHRLKIAWSYFRRGQAGYPRSAKAVPFAWPSWREGQPTWHIIDLQSYIHEGFDLNALIYSAVLYKCRQSYHAPLRAYEGDPDQPDRLPPNHPLAKLIARPNGYQSGVEFEALNRVYLNIAGECFIYCDRPSRGGLPTALYPLRPDRVHIVPKKGGVAGYVYVPEGKFPRTGEPLKAEDIMPMRPEDVMHVKLPNPGDPLEGMGHGLSPLSPLAQSADVDNNVTAFLKRFFERGTMLAGIITSDLPLDDEEIARIRARWKEIYGGWENMAEEIGVLGSGSKYQRLTMGFDEMGFEQIDERNEARILGPFGVPGILIGTRLGVNRAINANAQELRRQCWEDTLVPETMLFEAEYQAYLQSEDGGFVAFDFSRVPALQKDTPKLVQAAHQLWQMGMPANQAIRTVGLDAEPFEGGDVGYLPINLLPAGTPPPERAGQETAPAPDVEEETRKGIIRPFRRPHQRRLLGGGQDPDLEGHGRHRSVVGAQVCGCGGADVRERQTGAADHAE